MPKKLSGSKDYPPLLLLKDVSSKIPKVWQMIDLARPLGLKNAKCSSRIFAPVETATAACIACQAGKAKGGRVDIPYPSLVLALAQWRKDKEVFVLDPDLARILYEQDDTSIPAAAVDYLPYPCFYVETAGLDAYLPGVHGFFFYIGWDTQTRKELMSFIFAGKEGKIYPFDIPLDSPDLSECFDRMNRRKLLSKNAEIQARGRQELEQRDSVMLLLRCSLQVVLYLCACNAEIVPDPEQESVMKRSNGSEIKDRYVEIRKWDVGFVTGPALQAQKRRPQSEESHARDGSHAPKRPHVRRGHWHHFWTGAKSDAENRRLVLKWLPPIFVGSVDDDLPVVVHPVKEA